MVYVRPHTRRNPIAIGRWRRRRRAPISAYQKYKRRRHVAPRRRYGGAVFKRNGYTRKFTGYRKVTHKTGKAWGKYQKVAYRSRRRRRSKIFGLL